MSVRAKYHKHHIRQIVIDWDTWKVCLQKSPRHEAKGSIRIRNVYFKVMMDDFTERTLHKCTVSTIAPYGPVAKLCVILLTFFPHLPKLTRTRLAIGISLKNIVRIPFDGIAVTKYQCRTMTTIRLGKRHQQRMTPRVLPKDLERGILRAIIHNNKPGIAAHPLDDWIPLRDGINNTLRFIIGRHYYI